MISIKNSFADCSSCDLLNSKSSILDTNSKADLNAVDVVFVSDYPTEAESKKESFLIGKIGKQVRGYINEHIKNDFKYLVTSCVLCSPTLEVDEELDENIINTCKENCFKIIEQCNPKLIVLLGQIPMKVFGIAKTGITDLRGKIYKWNNIDVLLTIHPNFLVNNKTFEEKLEMDIKFASEFLGGTEELYNIKDQGKGIKGKKGIFRYDIPSKFYEDNYRLIDVQFLNNTKQILYMFRDKDNNRVHHMEDDTYTCYQATPDMEARKIIPYDDLVQVSVPYKEKATLDHEITYEGDMKLTSKRAIDYYHYSKGEAKAIEDNILFCDIEIDPGIKNKTFPTPQEALYPICMLSTYFNKRYRCYILDNKTEPIKDVENCELKIFTSEKKMIETFMKDCKEDEPDFMSGWNFIGFDMEYIFNRLKRLRISPSKFSKFGEFYVDAFRYVCHLAGCVVVDQLDLYKSFTFTKKPNYKLGNIGLDEIGMTKIKMPYPFHEMYWKALNKHIEYNIRDTELLVKLEDKLKHINLLNELRGICTTSFDSGGSPFGQIDSIMVSFLKSKGLASKNANPHIAKEKYPGAFVYEPIPGTYDNVTDFDFTALYPSIIMTYNIGTNNFVMKFKDPTHGYDLTYDVDNLPEQIDMIIDPVHKPKLVSVKKADLLKKIKESNLVYTINGCFFKSHEDEKSVYSEVLTNLLSSRKAYKGKMLDAKESGDKETELLFDTKQLVYKVLANSLYGVIANKAFRFFDVSCASAITLGGQESLKYSIIEGNAYMDNLHNGEYTKPNPITKKEMYSDIMPDRVTPYIITGDTDSIFCCFQMFPGQKSDEDIKAWCDQIQKYLNEDIILPMVENHNVKSEFNKLELKNELIISRGLFLAKKRYAIHVTNNEGRKVDRVISMGLETKRSDYPAMSKEFLEELLEMILKSKKVSISNMHKFIKNKEREFIDAIRKGEKSIARPCSYGKKLKDYKTIPQGVRAMEAFNKICYTAHSVGTKGYLYRVSGLDEQKAPKDVLENYYKYVAEYGKVNVIAIPDEEEVLPEYFIPDLKGNLKFAFIDRYELMLKPLTEVKKKKDLMAF